MIATASQEPTEVQVVRFGLDGSAEPITTGPAVHGAVVGGPTTVITRSALDHPSHHRHACIATRPARSPWRASRRRSSPASPCCTPGPHALRTAVLFPRDHVPGSRRLPVLMDPYGGPHAQRVLASSRMFLQSQWLADQGFCVVDRRRTRHAGARARLGARGAATTSPP